MTTRQGAAAPACPDAGDRLVPGDAGFLVISGMTKVLITLAVLGVVAFDLVALGLAHFQAGDRAANAAREASTACRTTGATVQTGYDAAYAVALEKGDSIDTESFRCTPTGDVTLTYRLTASTLLVERIGPLRRFTDVESTLSVTAPR